MSEKITIILCSDNHRFEEPLRFLQREYADADYFLHCGDSEMPKQKMDGYASVQGNNDCYGEYPNSLVLHIGTHNIYMSHGHHDMMFGHYEMLAEKAKRNHCDIAVCGHSHVPFAGVVNGVVCLNPGSIWRNRDGSGPSYMIVTLDGDEVHWEKKIYKK